MVPVTELEYAMEHPAETPGGNSPPDRCISMGSSPAPLDTKKRTPGRGSLFFGAGDLTRVHYGAPGGNAGWQQSTGLLHLHGFESVPPEYKKENPRAGFSFFGAGDRTRTGTLSPAADFESRG